MLLAFSHFFLFLVELQTIFPTWSIKKLCREAACFLADIIGSVLLFSKKQYNYYYDMVMGAVLLLTVQSCK